MIDCNIIKERKAVYGDNFAPLTQKVNEKLGLNLTQKQVIEFLICLKETRIETIKEKLSQIELESVCSFDEKVQLANKLQVGLQDSYVDMKNYEWIRDNFKKYKEL